MTKNPDICCPQFDPTPWNEKSLSWKNKSFIVGRVFTLFYMPLNFGAVITKLMKKAEDSGAIAADNMCLSDHTSKWNMNIYIAVDKEVEGVDNVKISGNFLSKVYEGDFKDTGIWCQNFEKYAASKNKKVKKWYMWYTTCPKCAKKWGKNYVVVVGEV